MRPAITVTDVAKSFKLIHQRNNTLKATVFNGFRRTEYEQFWALDGIDLEIPEGTTYGLIGHNGSGKSTLLKCIAKIYRPSRGEIVSRGQVTALLELGAGFHPELSGRENIYLNGSILGLSKHEIDRRFDEIVGFAGLERFIDSPVKNYSSGMFVRLGFSVAISVEPDILLVDEVLSVGDESFQQRCLAKFAELRRSGRTVVVVSHGLGLVRDLCDHAAWLDHGKLMLTGRSGAVVDHYLSYVRDQERSRRKAAVSGGGEPSPDVWIVAPPMLVDGRGRETDVLKAGKPFRVRVDLQSPHDEAVTLRVSVGRTDGVRVSELRTKIQPNGQGDSSITFTAESLPVTTGGYDLIATLTDERDQVVYVSSSTSHFDVVAAADNGGHGGIVSLDGDWRTKGIASIRADDPTG